MNLKEIEARHYEEQRHKFGPHDFAWDIVFWRAHSDRAALLAEVKRLHAFVAKVREARVVDSDGWVEYDTRRMDQALADINK